MGFTQRFESKIVPEVIIETMNFIISLFKYYKHIFSGNLAILDINF